VADPYTSGGYPVSPLERFVTGLESGYNSALDIKKKSQELKTALAYQEAADAKPKKGVEGDSGTTREGAYDVGSDGTTGSGGKGGGSGGGSVSSFDPKQTGDGHVAPKAERIEYYNQLAKEYGLNAQAILMTVDKEGLHKYVGDNGKSFGDFQMYTAGGMGNKALDAGINIRDPNTWKEQARYAMQQMAANKGNASWFAGQWHGPRNHAPWAVQNFSNPDATPPGGTRTATTAAPAAAPAIGSGTSTAPAPTPRSQLPPSMTSGRAGAGMPPQQGMVVDPYDPRFGSMVEPPAAAPAAAPTAAPTAAPAAAPAPAEPAAAPPAALQLPPVPSYGADLQKIQAPQGLRPAAPAPAAAPQPGQQSAIGNRPQAPPPASVLAQLVQQNPYLPQQIAALRQARQGAPQQSALYSGLA